MGLSPLPAVASLSAKSVRSPAPPIMCRLLRGAPHGIHLEGQRDGSHYRRFFQPHDPILGPLSECSSLLPLRGPNFVHLSFDTSQGGSSGILTSI